MGDATVAFWMELDAGLIGLPISLRHWLGHIGPAQNCEHARKHGKGSEGLHGQKNGLVHNTKLPDPASSAATFLHKSFCSAQYKDGRTWLSFERA